MCAHRTTTPHSSRLVVCCTQIASFEAETDTQVRHPKASRLFFLLTGRRMAVNQLICANVVDFCKACLRTHVCLGVMRWEEYK